MSTPAFRATDLRLELRDPGEFALVRLYKDARSGGPGGEWAPPPEAFRNLRVDPPAGHNGKFSVLYTSDTLACVAEECHVLQYNAADDAFQVDRALLAQYRVARYAYAAPALFVSIDPIDVGALGLQPRQYGPGMKLDTVTIYDRYQAASLALFERVGELAHGLSWQSMHRGQLGRVYAVWHHRKPHLQLSNDAARSGAWLADDGDWKTFEAENPGFQDVPAPGTGT